ncbi:phytoene/squalene synthase family protein [soil metagenome]
MTLAAKGYRLAEATTRDRARSFHFASRLLGRTTKARAFAVYAFCRRCDDAVDTGGKDLSRRVDDLRAQVEDAYLGDDRGDPILAAFGDTARATAIPKAAVLELIRGMEQDLTKTEYETWDELLDYCQLAAGTVGIMMASVLGVSHRGALENAAALGRAMQITNVLRDVGEDLEEHGRVYLPLVPLRDNGVTLDDLRSFALRRSLPTGAKGEGFRAVMREAAARADKLYRFADEGVAAITSRSGRACVRVMRASYSEILRVLSERGWDPFRGRASASTARKFRVSARALFEAR